MKLYIVGFSRAGKSTLGKSLAQYLKLPFIDTDLLIEAHTKQSIAEYVAISGWDAFRTLERQILQELGEASPPLPGSKLSQIVVCGGGIVELAENRAFLKKQRVIWLNPPWELILSRLQKEPSALCRHHSNDELYDLYQKRYPLYLEVISP